MKAISNILVVCFLVIIMVSRHIQLISLDGLRCRVPSARHFLRCIVLLLSRIEKKQPLIIRYFCIFCVLYTVYAVQLSFTSFSVMKPPSLPISSFQTVLTYPTNLKQDFFILVQKPYYYVSLLHNRAIMCYCTSTVHR